MGEGLCHCECVEVRERLGVGLLLLPCGSWGSGLCSEAWWPAPSSRLASNSLPTFLPQSLKYWDYTCSMCLDETGIKIPKKEKILKDWGKTGKSTEVRPIWKCFLIVIIFIHCPQPCPRESTSSSAHITQRLPSPLVHSSLFLSKVPCVPWDSFASTSVSYHMWFYILI